MEKIIFDEETEKDFQKWINQFEYKKDIIKDDEWYNDMRIIFWNLNNG
jgi:hypothetical protein